MTPRRYATRWICPGEISGLANVASSTDSPRTSAIWISHPQVRPSSRTTFALQQIRDAGQAEEWELVLDLVRRHADLSPPAEVARLRGVCWASLNFPSAAILFFRQIARYTTLRPEDEVFLLRCLVQVDRTEEAFRRAQEICAAGTTPSLLLTAATVLSVRASEVGQPEQDALCQTAIRAAERGLELAADNPV